MTTNAISGSPSENEIQIPDEMIAAAIAAHDTEEDRPAGQVEYSSLRTPIRLPLQGDLPLEMSLEQLSCGLLVTGSMGTGKTTGAILPILEQIIQHPAGIGALVLDLKDDYGDKCREIAARKGCPERVKVIEPGGPERMNLLFPWMPASKIADSMMCSLQSRAEDPFWVQSATRLLDLEISVVRELIGDSRGDITFDDIRAIHNELTTVDMQPGRKRMGSLLQAIIALLGDRAIAYQREHQAGATLLRKVEVLRAELERFAHMNDRTRTSITGTADAGLYPLGAELGYNFCAGGKDTTVSVSDIVDHGTILVVAVPRHTWGLAGQMIGTLVRRGLYSYLLTKRRSPRPDYRPVAVVMDEAQNYLAWDDSSEAEHTFASLARSLSCSLILATQDVASFYTIVAPSRHEAVDNFLRNVNTQIHLAQPYSHHLSRLLGEQGISEGRFVGRLINVSPKFTALVCQRPAVTEKTLVSQSAAVPAFRIVKLLPAFAKLDIGIPPRVMRTNSLFRRGAEFLRRGALRNVEGKGILIVGDSSRVLGYIDDARTSGVPHIRLEAMDLIYGSQLRDEVLADEIAKIPDAVVDREEPLVLLFLFNLEAVFENGYEALAAIRMLTTPSHTLIRTGITGLSIQSRMFRVIATWPRRPITRRLSGFLREELPEFYGPPDTLREFFEFVNGDKMTEYAWPDVYNG